MTQPALLTLWNNSENYIKFLRFYELEIYELLIV
jgi:hypothetical protein